MELNDWTPDKVISSYPNKNYWSKHQRFRPDHICACACDCDHILSFSSPPQKGGELCNMCTINEHQYPVKFYKDTQIEHKVFPIPEIVCDSCFDSFETTMEGIQHAQKFGHTLR